MMELNRELIFSRTIYSINKHFFYWNSSSMDSILYDLIIVIIGFMTSRLRKMKNSMISFMVTEYIKLIDDSKGTSHKDVLTRHDRHVSCD